jgi:hypothetical protein
VSMRALMVITSDTGGEFGPGRRRRLPGAGVPIGVREGLLRNQAERRRYGNSPPISPLGKDQEAGC